MIKIILGFSSRKLRGTQTTTVTASFYCEIQNLHNKEDDRKKYIEKHCIKLT